MRTTRRELLAGLGAAGYAAAQDRRGKPLDIQEYQPKSMLVVEEHHVERARYPVIDVHTHLTSSDRTGEKVNFNATPEELLAVMDRRNIRTMVNLTGGFGPGVKVPIETLDRKHPGRFVSFTQPWYARANEAGYAKFQADEIARANREGARGLKVLKSLGLVHRDTNGKLIRIDDPRFDPMWEACGALGMPVAIHIADPVAFFTPIDRFNERFEELNNHPDWSFHGRDYPKFEELLDARDRVFARHPNTQFIALHVGHYAENLGHVGRSLDKMPNMHVELGARIGELGRQPRTARKFFDKYQDRILFGTDAVPKGYSTPQQVFGDDLYRIYYRFLETEDEYFDYAPAPVPPQGRWRIYGLGLPPAILKKVYYDNAARLLKMPAVRG
ncbi:MAG TPA: amidohydrolase family protein [Bryobacteraceae bacterium]|nr:amidohydrolase family protein [Bryobacteraceae bacterium]